MGEGPGHWLNNPHRSVFVELFSHVVNFSRKKLFNYRVGELVRRGDNPGSQCSRGQERDG